MLLDGHCTSITVWVTLWDTFVSCCKTVASWRGTYYVDNEVPPLLRWCTLLFANNYSYWNCILKKIAAMFLLPKCHIDGKDILQKFNNVSCGTNYHLPLHLHNRDTRFQWRWKFYQNLIKNDVKMEWFCNHYRWTEDIRKVMKD